MRRLALTMLLLTSTAAMAAEHDIPWFQAHPAERGAWLRKCRDDMRLGQDPVCGNAQKAEDRERARKIAPSSPIPGFDPTESPLMRGAIQDACKKPESQRGMFGQYCGRI